MVLLNRPGQPFVQVVWSGGVPRVRRCGAEWSVLAWRCMFRAGGSGVIVEWSGPVG